MTFPAMEIPLAGTHRKYPQTDAETLVNLYAEKVGSRYILKGSPGYALFGTAPGSLGIRNIHTVGDRTFAVRGNTFSEWTGSEYVSRGTLSSEGGFVGMADNGEQVLIVDQTRGYGYNLSDENSFAEIQDFPGGGAQAWFCAGRFFTIQPGTRRFYNSDFASDGGAFSWPALNFYEKNSTPGDILALASLGQTMIVLSEDGQEIWSDQSYPDTPLRRTQSGSTIGISAPASVQVFDRTAFWLGGGEGEAIVYRSSGTETVRISNSQIEALIRALPGTSDARGFIYQEEGNIFYVLSFMQGQKTFCYDVTMSPEEGWSERVFRNPSTGQLSQHVGVCHTVYQGKTLIGDYRNGNVYELSLKYATDNGDIRYYERAFPPVPVEANSLTRHVGFELMMDVGDAAVVARDTEALLDFSDDRGKTWSREFPMSIGGQGQYGRRLVWYGLGSAFTRNYRLRFTTDRVITLRSAQVRI